MRKGQIIEHVEGNHCELEDTFEQVDVYKNLVNGRRVYIEQRNQYKDLSVVRLCRELGIDVPSSLEDMAHVFDLMDQDGSLQRDEVIVTPH